MEEPFTTLIKKSVKAYAKSSAEETWKAKVLAIVLFPIVVPALLIGAAISIPWTQIMRVKQRRDEARFAKQMKVAGRIMGWAELKSAIGEGKGTVIGEYLSMKGPFRLWWTPEDIPRTSPYACEKEVREEWMESEPREFFQWCYSHFTNSESGLARLVIVPEEERRQLKTTLEGVRYVAIWSFRQLREKRYQESKS
jgi:hypothetical protein